MAMNTFGDMASAYALRHQNTLLKKDIQQLNQELATGKAADIGAHLGGSYSRLTGIERDMRRLDGYNVSLSEANQFTEIMQQRLDQIRDLSSDFSRDLLAGDMSTSGASADLLAADARVQFSTVVSMLNSETAGRNLFAGDTTDVDPLVDAETFLAELETVVAGATTAADIMTALDAWFASPAGFDSFAYKGSTTAITPLKMSEAATVSVDIRADNPVLKDTLKTLAAVVMTASPGTALPNSEKGDLFRQSAMSLITTESALIGLQAKVGVAQEQIERWSVRNQSEKAGLDYAKNALLAIDPFEAATKLETAQFQLESLYSVTVRLSQLSLVKFLR